MRNKYALITIIMLIQLSGCFGGGTIADASFVSPHRGALKIEGLDFSGKAYMLNKEDLMASNELKEQLEQVYGIKNALSDEEFDPVLNILSADLFAQRTEDQLEQQINELRTILQQATPQWEQAQNNKKDKLKEDLKSYKSTYSKDSALLDSYNEFVKNERAQVAEIEKQISDNKDRMKLLTQETMDYMNKVIVDEALPVKKIKPSGMGVVDNMKYIFQIERGFFPEGTKGFKESQRLEQKKLVSYKLIETVNGKRYSVPLNNIIYKEIIQTPKHYKYILENYIEFAELAWISTPGVYQKPEGQLLKDLRQAKEIMSKKSLVASNKYDIDSLPRLLSDVNRNQKLIENTEKALAAPENQKAKAQFMKKLTAKARNALKKPLNNIIPQVVGNFYASIEQIEEVTLKASFGIPDETQVVAIHGTSVAPNLFTGKPVKADTFQVVSMADFDLERSRDIVIAFSDFKQRRAFERLSDIAKLR